MAWVRMNSKVPPFKKKKIIMRINHQVPVVAMRDLNCVCPAQGTG